MAPKVRGRCFLRPECRRKVEQNLKGEPDLWWGFGQVLQAGGTNSQSKGINVSPCATKRMRFGVEDDVIEVERLGRGEEKIEILERFREDEALHFIALLFRDDVLEGGVTGF